MSSITSATNVPALRGSTIFSRLADEGLVVTIVAVFGTIVFATAPYMLQPDSWLTYIGGQQIWAHGIPHRDSLALASHGQPWIDQQWLAQLAIYGLAAAFGNGITVAINAVLVVAAFAWACRLARKSASARSVVLFAFLAVPFSFSSLRAQTFSYVMFVPLFAFLCAESRRPTRRVWLTLPLLVLWANMHGSVVIAAALVGLLGVVQFFQGLRRRGALLAAGAAASVVATPYGLSLLGYYRSTMGNPLFKKYISEWAPPTFPSTASVPLLLIAGVGLILIARRPRHFTIFELAALLLLFLGGLAAVRSAVWFSYAALLLLPGLLDRSWPPRRVLGPARLLVAATGAGSLVLCLCAVGYGFATGPKITRTLYPPAALEATRAALAAHPHARLLADDRTADWLLWELPQLKGQIAFTGRWEVLTRPEFQAARDFIKQAEPDPARYERGYQLFAVDPYWNKKLARAYAASGFRLVYRARRIAVYER
ncbi:MAG TPA: hypothetical protein VHQ89_09695 [Gaiellaceae bacterium]|nr:hypothetical protein [Gaiellaceae bacterium]